MSHCYRMHVRSRVLVLAAAVLLSAGSAGARPQTTAPPAVVNVKVTITDTSIGVTPKTAVRGAYVRFIVVNRGSRAPPRGAVVFARQWGGEALALGVVPRPGGALVQASVLGGQGKGVSGLVLSVNGHRAAPCGAGCYRAVLLGKPGSVELRVRS